MTSSLGQAEGQIYNREDSDNDKKPFHGIRAIVVCLCHAAREIMRVSCEVSRVERFIVTWD
jgi:hypothetical protein